LKGRRGGEYQSKFSANGKWCPVFYGALDLATIVDRLEAFLCLEVES
jgi:hypothetical protein